MSPESEFRWIEVVEVQLVDALSISLCREQKAGFRFASDYSKVFMTTVDWLCEENPWALVNDAIFTAPATRHLDSWRIMQSAEEARAEILLERKVRGKQHLPLRELLDGRSLYVKVRADPEHQLLLEAIEYPRFHPSTYPLTMPMWRHLMPVWKSVRDATDVPPGESVPEPVQAEDPEATPLS